MRRGFALVVAAGSLGLSACLPPGGSPPSPDQCATAASGTAPGPARPPDSPGPIPPGEAGNEARVAVAESETRTPDGSIPLVTVEDTPAGSEIVTTPVADADEAAAIAEGAAADGDLTVVEVDVPVRAAVDPLRDQQWALNEVAFEAASALTAGGAGITIAIVDTGVQGNHGDFRSGQVLPGQVFLDQGPAESGGTTDDNGHGTHVAGIVGAQAGNDRGIHGAAPGVDLLPVKVLDCEGVGWSSDVARGIQWATANGADVINLSLGSSTASGAQQDAIQDARDAGVVVVAAAGNEFNSSNSPQFPGAFPEVIAVGATDEAGDKAGFSSTGSYLDLAAPGVGILSTLNNGGYGTKNGTSMATPYVAAAVALTRAAHGSSNAQGLCTQLIRTADDLGDPQFDTSFGHGLVDPLEAVGPIIPTGPNCT